MSWVYFIIRADAQGRPTHLEYRTQNGDVYVISQQ